MWQTAGSKNVTVRVLLGSHSPNAFDSGMKRITLFAHVGRGVTYSCKLHQLDRPVKACGHIDLVKVHGKIPHNMQRSLPLSARQDSSVDFGCQLLSGAALSQLHLRSQDTRLNEHLAEETWLKTCNTMHSTSVIDCS